MMQETEAEFFAKQKAMREAASTRAAYIEEAPRLVVTKCQAGVTIGNDTVFLRVRRRGLQQAPSWSQRARYTSSASYDLVHAVRVNGKPRHKFVLGLGSIKNPPSNHDLIQFWCRVVVRLCRATWGPQLTDESLAEVVRLVARKVPLPAAEAFTAHANGRNLWQHEARKIAAIAEAPPTEEVAP